MSPELTSLLRETSRSFFLTVQALPRAVREPIGVGYLLARTTDTVVDTDLVSSEQRLDALDHLRRRAVGNTGGLPDFSDFTSAENTSATPGERRLLDRIASVIAALEALPAGDRDAVRRVLDIITSGQALDLQRFAGASATSPVALSTGADLDDYTYRVAGSVGEFWSEITVRHLFPKGKINAAQFFHDGRRFGQGLQLVNILRDLPKDLRQGRCYLPALGLKELGLAPVDLTDAKNEGRLRPLLAFWSATAARHLAAGWRHVNTVPPSQCRLRLAEAWPVLLGARTLALLRSSPALDPNVRVKVSRTDLRRVMVGTLWRLAFPNLWRRQFHTALGAPTPDPDC